LALCQGPRALKGPRATAVIATTEDRSIVQSKLLLLPYEINYCHNLNSIKTSRNLGERENLGSNFLASEAREKKFGHKHTKHSIQACITYRLGPIHGRRQRKGMGSNCFLCSCPCPCPWLPLQEKC